MKLLDVVKQLEELSMSKITYSIYYPGEIHRLSGKVNFDQQAKKKNQWSTDASQTISRTRDTLFIKEIFRPQMAGGEFCGNAARSMAMAQYSGPII